MKTSTNPNNLYHYIKRKLMKLFMVKLLKIRSSKLIEIIIITKKNSWEARLHN